MCMLGNILNKYPIKFKVSTNVSCIAYLVQGFAFNPSFHWLFTFMAVDTFCILPFFSEWVDFYCCKNSRRAICFQTACQHFESVVLVCDNHEGKLLCPRTW